MSEFNSLGLSEHLISMLAVAGYTTPTPIQARAIPHLLAGKDMIGLAQTGTGKTAAFGLPLIDRLMESARRPEPKEVRALILAPTRELVTQIATALKIFTKKTPLKVTIVVGGASINKQMQETGRGSDILVATPGRLIDLANRRSINLTATRFLILDEADQMLDLGFIHDLKKIVKMVPAKRQTMLFSATMPRAIADLAGEYLTNPVQVEVTPPGKAADKVEQSVHFVPGKDQKTVILKDLLTANPDARALVFLRTKHGAEKLMKHLEHCGYSVASIHGNKSQGQRERALKAFRDGDIKALIATDVAARGIDVPGVTHVVNYDLPNVPDAYVHRIGRTARAGAAGLAVAFCTPDETKMLFDIEKLMGLEIATASGTRPERGQRMPAPAGDRAGQQPARKKQHRKGQGQGQGRPQAAGANQGERRNGPAAGKPARPAAAAAAPSSFSGMAGQLNEQTRAATPKRADGAPRADNRHRPAATEGRSEQAGRGRGPVRFGGENAPARPGQDGIRRKTAR